MVDDIVNETYHNVVYNCAWKQFYALMLSMLHLFMLMAISVSSSFSADITLLMQIFSGIGAVAGIAAFLSITRYYYSIEKDFVRQPIDTADRNC